MPAASLLRSAGALPGWISRCTPRMANARRALSRQGSPELRWAIFEAAKNAARPGSPDYAYYRTVAARPDSGKRPTLAVGRKILRRSHHTLRELGDAALAMPIPEAKGGPPEMRVRVPCP